MTFIVLLAFIANTHADEVTDIVKSGGSVQGFAKFDWNRTYENEFWQNSPSASILVRVFMPQRSFIKAGFALGIGIGFLTEFEYTIPNSYKGTGVGLSPGQKIKVSWNDSDSLYNISIFAGTGFCAEFTGFFALVFDLGIAFSFNTASWERSLSYPIKLYSDVSTNYFGTGANLGLQLRLGSLTCLEAGVSAYYFFWKWNTIEVYKADPKDKTNTKETIENTSGNFEVVKAFRYSTPYVAIGFKF